VGSYIGQQPGTHQLFLVRVQARADVRRQAMAMTTGGSGALSPSNTIADAVELWLSHFLTRAKAGSLAYSTYESYETTARVILVPRCGGVRLDQLTVGRRDRILPGILEEETVSKARCRSSFRPRAAYSRREQFHW